MVDYFEGKPKQNKHVPFLRQCFLTASVCLNVTAHGCVIGFPAILIPSLRLPESHIKATPGEESWIASVIGFALILGNIIITPLMGIWGRKKCHLLTILPIMVGWIMLTLVDSVAGLITARFLQGIAMGMLGPLGSLIIGEMTNPKNRGPFLTGVSLSLTIGVICVHSLGTFFTWQQVALYCSFITFTSCICIIYNPESPSWLLSKGRIEETREVFFYLRGQDKEQEEELTDMINAYKARKNSVVHLDMSISARTRRSFTYFIDACHNPEFYKPIFIMLLLYTMFQFAGINVISSYATDIINQVVGTDLDARLLMVALDMERLVCNILAVFLMKVLKRRTLLFSTGTLCVLAYISKGVYVYAREANILQYDKQWLPLLLIGIYMCSLTAGISSIPFTISGEIFPLQYRGLGSGISVLALSANFFVSVKCFPVLTGAVGLSVTYYMYASVVVCCLCFLWFMLPETKDRTLLEIEENFRGISSRDRRSAVPLNGKTDACENREMMRRCSSVILY